MRTDPETCYRALRSRDARFDGLFFVGVSSTGVYCRPVCTARTPKRENCTFFASAAAAEAAGFRPCLRCRPELAPGNGSVDAPARIAHAATAMIEDGACNDDRIGELAARLGVTARHLRRAFRAAYGVSPVQYAQTQRLLLAKRLLTDTALPVTSVAIASGFRSLRRFNALFLARYRMSPTALRKRAGTAPADGRIQTRLGYRPPFDWAGLIGFLGPRTVDGVEQVDGATYRRTVRLARRGGELRGWIAVRHDPARRVVEADLDAALLPALPQALARVRRLFDLAAHPEEIAAALGPLAEPRPGLRVPGAFDGFELAVRAVLGQQVSVRAARTLAGRFARRFGDPIETPFAGLDVLFPTPETVSRLEPAVIAELGVVAARARTIVALARALAGGTLRLDHGSDVEATLAALRELPGVGEWTTQYIAMRALSWPDAFPHADLGLRKALGEPSPRRILAAGERWRPWRAYAAMHLWRSLDGAA
ncbi:MAG TPA: DNA-3-methyladenine glycosylase 2 [Thermoanaerobaculaceae bacterium]|nr:DNA-3-methyladenine glycosylase 2 [Thermoanaerobaculaceae bacterium]